MFNQEILFTKEECDVILKEHSSFKRSISADTTHITDAAEVQRINDWRTSYDSHIDLSESTKNLILSKLKKYDIVDMDSVSTVVRYEVGQQFKPHRDSEDGFEHRYKTMVIQLSDETQYTGGELKVWKKDGTIITASKHIGNTILFNSDLLHEATSITSGTRYIWITWLRFNHFKKTKQLI